MEWCPAGWSMCLPLLIFPCTIKSRSSLLALTHLGGPGKKAIKRLCVVVVVVVINTCIVDVTRDKLLSNFCFTAIVSKSVVEVLKGLSLWWINVMIAPVFHSAGRHVHVPEHACTVRSIKLSFYCRCWNLCHWFTCWLWCWVDSQSAASHVVEPEGLYRLCKKLDDDELCAGMTRSKPVKKTRKDRRKLSVVSVRGCVLSPSSWSVWWTSRIVWWSFVCLNL